MQWLRAGGVHEDDYVHALVANGVRGLVFVSGINALEGVDPRRYQALIDKGVPIVLVNGAIQGLSAPSYSMDDAAAVELAVAHLADLGHQRIGLALGEPRYQPVIRRMAAFPAAMRTRVDAALTDVELDELVTCTGYSIEDGTVAASTLLDRGATALICGSDLMAIGAVAAAQARGLRVPEDVSVIGSDDSNLMPYLSPPLTTVRQPADAIGAASAAALMDQIAGGKQEFHEHLLPPELVIRSSTGVAPRA